jgi:Kef-type K+ transport system membrane component KefB
LFAPMLHTRFSPNNFGRIPFALFVGVSMSITAFPVLARIIEERNLQRGGARRNRTFECRSG